LSGGSVYCAVCVGGALWTAAGVVGAAGVAAEACASAVWDEMPVHNASRQREPNNFMRQASAKMWGTRHNSRKSKSLKRRGNEETEGTLIARIAKSAKIAEI
jgi:hypothetical protein